MRPYSPNNIFQITKTRNGAEWGALNLNMDGSFSLNAYNAEEGQSQHILRGTTDGRLLWRDQNMIFVKESWVSGTSWYRVWSDGYIEQGGSISNNSTTTTITFSKAFSNANYSIVGGLLNGTASTTYEHMNFNNLTKTGFKFTTYDNYGVRWVAMGY